MRLARFVEGALVDFDGHRYRLVGRMTDGLWQAVDVETNRLIEWPWNDMTAAYEAGHLVLVPFQWDERTTGTASVLDLPDRKREIALKRSRFLERVDARRVGRHLDRAGLSALLKEVSAELKHDRPVSISAYYRWRAAVKSGGGLGLAGKQSGPKGRRCTGAVLAKQVMLEQIVAAHQTRKVGVAPVATLKAMRQKTISLIKVENARQEALSSLCRPLEVPSVSTFQRIWKDLPAEDRAVAGVGKVAAAHIFRGGSGQKKPGACLDQVEYDETRVPMFLFDESLGVPLGRPWLAWYVDVYSNAPVGFYLGFENPSDLTIASALRHCCLPKSYVAREYPKIINSYAPAGVPRKVTFDNGLSQWGGTIEALAFDLDMAIHFARPRTPWFKARVEGMFEVLNKTLLRELPGFVLGKDMHEYDPTRHGCIGLRHFLYILHAWLVDVYLQEPQGPFLRSPASMWEEGTREHPPFFVPQSQDLDLLFGIKRTGRLDHRGVRYENLWFQSPELQALRRRHGDKLAVEVKVDPSNLAFVHARVPKLKTGWVRAEANFRSYADHLSLHRHKLNLRNAREKFDDISAASLERAQDFLHELIADALPAAMSIRTNSLIARTLGIGTQHVFNNLNHDGELTGLTGPFAGKALNPFDEGRSAASQNRAPFLRGPQPTSGPDRVRIRRTFDGDHSLKGPTR